MAFNTTPLLSSSFCTEATFRLACQWSPTTWLSWTQADCNVHRIRLIYRLLAYPELKDSAHANRFNPIKSCLGLAPLLGMTDLQLDQVLSILPKYTEADSKFPYLSSVWNLTPGLLALQQLLQPLLEIILLADRVWHLRDKLPHELSFTGLVRLFDPGLSPRCMALVARRYKAHVSDRS
ncbi:unnamed protein product [Echinostoma caproni]|uniref:Uncharacterized protein n=1 Tax=Echinostoma caproni TaxID=27848 RepID=A0A183A8Z3_9TREM|nr:unnamed protein product [Echinostoma caproni]